MIQTLAALQWEFRSTDSSNKLAGDSISGEMCATGSSSVVLADLSTIRCNRS